MESKKQNKKQNKTNKLIDTENKLVVDNWVGFWGMDEKGKESKKYKLPVIKIVMGM